MPSKKAPPGQKLRRIHGGADSVCTMAAIEALRATRWNLAMSQEGKPLTPEEFDQTVQAAMFDYMDARCDLTAPSPKDHWEKMKRYLSKPFEPKVVEVVTVDPNEDFDAWLDSVDGKMPADPLEPFKAEGAKWAKEFARRGQQGQKFFVRKVEIEDEPYLVVGSSSGEVEHKTCHANGAVGGTQFSGCNSERVVQDERGRLLKVYCKDYEERTYWVQFLVLKDERDFRIWWNVDGKDEIQHRLVMDAGSEHGFRKHSTRTFTPAVVANSV